MTRSHIKSPTNAAEMAAAVAQVRAEIDAARKIARARFAKDWGGLSPREAMHVAVANAHLFK